MHLEPLGHAVLLLPLKKNLCTLPFSKVADPVCSVHFAHANKLDATAMDNVARICPYEEIHTHEPS